MAKRVVPDWVYRTPVDREVVVIFIGLALAIGVAVGAFGWVTGGAIIVLSLGVGALSA
jgi:hypothetical protein